MVSNHKATTYGDKYTCIIFVDRFLRGGGGERGGGGGEGGGRRLAAKVLISSYKVLNQQRSTPIMSQHNVFYEKGKGGGEKGERKKCTSGLTGFCFRGTLREAIVAEG